jgi:hypothetical protein
MYDYMNIYDADSLYKLSETFMSTVDVLKQDDMQVLVLAKLRPLTLTNPHWPPEFDRCHDAMHIHACRLVQMVQENVLCLYL